MYYSHSCSYCSKIFYTYNDDKELAAQTLYAGIKQHLIDYKEDEKESKFDHGASIDTNTVYSELAESTEAPSGGYQL